MYSNIFLNFPLCDHGKVLSLFQMMMSWSVQPPVFSRLARSKGNSCRSPLCLIVSATIQSDPVSLVIRYTPAKVSVPQLEGSPLHQEDMRDKRTFFLIE